MTQNEQLLKEIEELKQENNALRSLNEQMRELVLRFTDGMLAFEVRGGGVRPLYMTDNVCRFFGYSREEWMELMKHSHPIGDFVSKSGIPLEIFLKLLQSGEAEFKYLDISHGTFRKIKAICSRTPGDEDRCYVLLYDMGELQGQREQKVQIRTFGYFDVFVGGKPIAFRNEKSKELFALLVDRRGGFVTSGEAISYLWEDEPVNPVTLARYRKVALRLKNLLEEYGIAHIVEAVDGKRRIVPELVCCDLYDYLSRKPEHQGLFKGSYLLNYSWGETTCSELLSEK